MKKMTLIFLCILTMGFAEDLVIENQTSYPSKHPQSKIAIQWAASGKEVEAANSASIHGQKLNPATMQILTQSGTIRVTIPKQAEYFRVIVWLQEGEAPNLLTNWVDAIPDKTYTLKTEHLVPTVLMCGMGC